MTIQKDLAIETAPNVAMWQGQSSKVLQSKIDINITHLGTKLSYNMIVKIVKSTFLVSYIYVEILQKDRRIKNRSSSSSNTTYPSSSDNKTQPCMLGLAKLYHLE
jgi:hypothetical protein